MRLSKFIVAPCAFACAALATADELNDSAGLDPTFGNAGKVIIAASTENPAASNITIADVAAQADGKIVIADGDDQNDIFVMRLNADGSLDTTFRDGGFARFCCGVADAIALRPDGRILMAFHETTNGALFVLQLLASGA